MRSNAPIDRLGGEDQEPADTWGAWEHLATPMRGLSHVAPTVTLNYTRLDDRGKALLNAISRRVPEILPKALKSVSLERSKLEELLREIAALVEPDRGFEYQRRLLEVIDHGNRCGQFKIPIPYIPAPLPAPKRSPFVHENFEALADFGDLLKSFSRSLGTSLSLAPSAWWGRTFLAAMLYGGLLRPEWLLALPEALARKPDPWLRWLDLRLPIRPASSPTAAAPAAQSRVAIPESTGATESAFVLRRWFVDPLTRILLARAPGDITSGACFPGRSSGDKIMRVAREYVRVAAISGTVPPSFAKLADVAKTRLHLNLPPYLAEYLAGNFANTSLPVQSWMRLVRPPERVVSHLPDLPKRSLAFQVLPAEADAGTASRDVAATEAAEQQTWVEEYRDFVGVVHRGGKDVRAAVRSWRTTSRGGLLPSIDALAQWVDEWLLKRRGGRPPLSNKTIYQYLRTAGRELVGLLGDTNPTKLLDEDAYIELYESILEGIDSIGERRRAATALRHWHDFLVLRFNVPEIETSTVMVSGGRTPPNVDANIIGTDTFFRALQWLRMEANRKDATGNLADALCRIAALGFFAGLRRSEAIGLQLKDLRGSKDVTLTVTPNMLRALKTRNANRNLPLSELMPGVELDQQLAWREHRRAAGAERDDLLFPGYETSDGKSLRNSHQHLTLITEALQRATHDRSFRFHHLRHSFASWMLLKFWVVEQSSESDRLPLWFLPTEHDRIRFSVAPKERKALLGNAPTNRRGLMQVSRLLGHGSVAITLGSYVHVIDFIAGLAVTRLAPQLDAACTGRPILVQPKAHRPHNAARCAGSRCRIDDNVVAAYPCRPSSSPEQADGNSAHAHPRSGCSAPPWCRLLEQAFRGSCTSPALFVRSTPSERISLTSQLFSISPRITCASGGRGFRLWTAHRLEAPDPPKNNARNGWAYRSKRRIESRLRRFSRGSRISNGTAFSQAWARGPGNAVVKSEELAVQPPRRTSTGWLPTSRPVGSARRC